MIDFGCIHNGLPRRVHAWFDVDPEENPGRRETTAAYLKAAGIAIRARGGWGRRAPSKPGCIQRTPAQTTRRYVYKLRGVTTEESSMHGNYLECIIRPRKSVVSGEGRQMALSNDSSRMTRKPD